MTITGWWILTWTARRQNKVGLNSRVSSVMEDGKATSGRMHRALEVLVDLDPTQAVTTWDAVATSMCSASTAMAAPLTICN